MLLLCMVFFVSCLFLCDVFLNLSVCIINFVSAYRYICNLYPCILPQGNVKLANTRLLLECLYYYMRTSFFIMLVLKVLNSGNSKLKLQSYLHSGAEVFPRRAGSVHPVSEQLSTALTAELVEVCFVVSSVKSQLKINVINNAIYGLGSFS